MITTIEILGSLFVLLAILSYYRPLRLFEFLGFYFFGGTRQRLSPLLTTLRYGWKYGVVWLALAIGLMGLMSPMSAGAQTTLSSTNASSPLQFVYTAFAWGTSANTNLSWQGTTLEVGVGADYQNGLQFANNIDAQYDIGGGNFGVGAEMENAGIGGVVEEYDAKLEYSILNYYDLRAEVSLNGGYNREYSSAVFQPRITLRKMIGANSFLEIYVGEPIYVRQAGTPNPWDPTVGIGTGFCGGNTVITQQVSLRQHGARFMSSMRRHLDPWHYE